MAHDTVAAKKAVRFATLQRFFVERRGYDPTEKFDAYIVRLLTDLGEIYDENSDMIRGLMHTERPDKQRELDVLQARERMLHMISAHMREGLGIGTKESFKIDYRKTKRYRDAKRNPEKPSETSKNAASLHAVQNPTDAVHRTE